MLKCVKLVTFGELHNARTVGDAEVCKKKKKVTLGGLCNTRTVGDAEVCKKKKKRLHLVDCVMPELYEMLKVCKKKMVTLGGLCNARTV